MRTSKAYSLDELAWLEANCALPIAEYHRQFCERFGRDVPAVRLKGYRVFRGWKTGRPWRFVKGGVSPTKGKPLHPNSGRWFQKGNKIGGSNRLPIGTERVNAWGHRERKMSDEGPPRLRWKLVHKIEWEAVNGPIPADMVLKCKGDRSNNAPSNFDLVPRAALPRLNGLGRHDLVAYDTAPDEIKPSILAVAKLQHAIDAQAES